MYKIFLDQNKIFECNVNIEGASMSDSEARLFLEAENFTLSFRGKINKDGSVKIPINKLKDVLTEDYTGKIFLEVIAEDTVFVPWESKYHTDVSKKVKVSVNESLSESTVISKPKISFSLVEDAFNPKDHINEIYSILSKNNVNKKTLYNNQKIFNKLVETYCQLNDIMKINDIDNLKKELLKGIK